MVGVARNAQSTKNNKFAISLWYLKKEVRDKYDFCMKINIQNFLQADNIIFTGDS